MHLSIIQNDLTISEEQLKQLIQKPQKYTFNTSEIPTSVLNKLCKKQMFGEICLKNRVWEKQKINLYCQFIEEWRIEKLMICDNSEIPILRPISGIKFNKLVNIVLWRNNLSSIEGFHRIWLPVLKEIWLNQNNLSNISDFRKYYSQNRYLTGINLSNNKINQINELMTENFLNTQDPLQEIQQYGLKSIVIEDSFNNKNQAFDINALAKITRKRNRGVVWIMSRQRIINQKLCHILVKKFNETMSVVYDDDL